MVHPRNREAVGLRTSCPKRGRLDSSFIQGYDVTKPLPKALSWNGRLTLKTVTNYHHNSLKSSQGRVKLTMMSIQAAWAVLMEQLGSTGHKLIPPAMASVFYFIISQDTSSCTFRATRPKFLRQSVVTERSGYGASSPFRLFDIFMVWCGTGNINSPASFSHTSQLSNTSQGQHVKEVGNLEEW